MKIRVEDIPEEGLSLDVKEDAGEIAALAGGLDFRILSPVEARIDLRESSGNVYVNGSMKALLEMDCSRCARAFKLPIDSAISVFFAREKEEAKELELRDSDMEVSYLEGPEIDTTEVILSQLALDVPMQPLCSEGCRGLCPVCGQDLNEKDCGCARKEKIDPRLAALKGFKEKKR